MALDAMPVHLVLPGVAAPKEVRVTGTSTSRRGNASPPLGKKKSKNPCSKCPLSSTGCDHCLELKEHAERHALKCMLSYAENGEVRPGRKYRFADLADERGTPWPEIKLMMPKATEAVESAFDNNKEKLMDPDNVNKKHVILTAAVESIVMAAPADELKIYRDLVLPRRAERIETKKRSK